MGDLSDKDMRRLNEFLTKVPPSKKIQIDDLLKIFKEDFRITEFTFPQTLSNIERGYIHARCAQLGLKSTSSGQGIKRRLTVSKRKELNQVVLKKMDLSGRSQGAMKAISEDLGQAEQWSRIQNENPDPRMTDCTYLTHSQRTGNDYTHRISCSPEPRIPKKKRSNRISNTQEDGTSFADVSVIDLTNTQEVLDSPPKVPIVAPPSKHPSSRQYLARFCPRVRFQQLQNSKGSSDGKQYIPSSPQVSLSKFKSLKIQHEKLQSELKSCKSSLEDMQEKVTLLDYGISFRKKTSGGQFSLKPQKAISDIVLESLEAPIFKIPQRKVVTKVVKPQSKFKGPNSTCKCSCSSSCCVQDNPFDNKPPKKRSLPPLSDEAWKQLRRKHKAEFLSLFGDSQKTTDSSTQLTPTSLSSGFSSSSSSKSKCSQAQKDSGYSSTSSSFSSSDVPSSSDSTKIALTIAKNSQARNERMSQETQDSCPLPAPGVSNFRERLKEVSRNLFKPQPSQLLNTSQASPSQSPVHMSKKSDVTTGCKLQPPAATRTRSQPTSERGVTLPSVPVFNKNKNTWDIKSYVNAREASRSDRSTASVLNAFTREQG